MVENPTPSQREKARETFDKLKVVFSRADITIVTGENSTIATVRGRVPQFGLDVFVVNRIGKLYKELPPEPGYVFGVSDGNSPDTAIIHESRAHWLEKGLPLIEEEEIGLLQDIIDRTEFE